MILTKVVSVKLVVLDENGVETVIEFYVPEPAKNSKIALNLKEPWNIDEHQTLVGFIAEPIFETKS